MSKENALMVAAIDFGTTYSGYAFSFRHEFEQDPLKVSASSWTTGSRATISLKTSTCILLRPNGQFDSFGFEAEDRYSDLALDNEHRDWFYFRRFKMMLYDSKNIHRTSTLKDEIGKEMQAIEVFAACIRYLKEHMMRSIRDRMYGVEGTDIRWVLTIPAIWDDPAKQFMREAAVQAGISGDNLSLALEPEAASMFCKYLPVACMHGSPDEKLEITCFQPKSKYLVLDAGGGTVDITVHEVLTDSKVRELCKTNGGAWGGTSVDGTFVSFMQDIVGAEVMTRFFEEQTEDCMDLLREFEMKKRVIRPEMTGRVTFKVPITLHETYRDITNSEIREDIRSNPNFAGKITFAGDKMRVDADVIKSLFEKTTSTITDHIKSIFVNSEASGISTVLMVGGFSESPMLQDAVRKTFPNVKVIIPNDAGLAVLKGAVIFGHNSTAITSRVARFTYGLKCYKPYNPSIHPKERMKMHDGKQMVRGCFDKLIEAGQSVSRDEHTAGHSYVPTGGKDRFRIKLYASPRQNPIFVDEPDCRHVGEVSVDCCDKRGSVGGATVHLIFGGTELEVKAIHNTSGEQTKAAFDFLE